MWFKVFVFGIMLVGLSRNVSTKTYTSEELAVATIALQRIGKSLNYTQPAINRVIDAVIFSNTNEEVVLMLEGALYQTREQRLLSGDTRQYNVRKSLKAIVETNTIDTSTWKTFDEDKLGILRQQIERQFPKEVADIIVNSTRERSNPAETPEQQAKSAMDFFTLLFDGATAIDAQNFPMHRNPVGEKTFNANDGKSTNICAGSFLLDCL